MDDYERPKNIMAASTLATVPAYAGREAFEYRQIQYLRDDTPHDQAVKVAEMFTRSLVEAEMLARLGFGDEWFKAAPPAGESAEHDEALGAAERTVEAWLELVTMDTRLHQENPLFAEA